MKYQKAPEIVDATQFDGTDEQASSLIATYGKRIWRERYDETWTGRLCVAGDSGVQVIATGDWLIIAANGDLSVCGAAEFAAQYTAV